MKQTSASRLIKEAGIGQSGRRDVANAAAEKLAQYLDVVPENLEKPLTDKMAEIHGNSRRIREQTDVLLSRTAAMKTHVAKWTNLSRSVDTKIKELGNVQNWAEMLDQEIRTLEETARICQVNKALR